MLRVTAGTTFAIGRSRQDWINFRADASAFSGETWTVVGRTEALGEIGVSWETFDLGPFMSEHGDGDTATTVKSHMRGGQMRVAMGMDDTDPGQQAMIEAAHSHDDYGFRLTFTDGSARHWVGTIIALNDVFDEASSVMRRVAEIAINSRILRIQGQRP